MLSMTFLAPLDNIEINSKYTERSGENYFIISNNKQKYVSEGRLQQPSPQTVFALVLKITQPRGKIAPGTFKFILSLYFREKISNLVPTPGIG